MGSRRIVGAVALTVAVVVALTLLPEAAWAGPGGIVKAATQTFFGRVVLAVLGVIFAPFIAYAMIREAIAVKRTQKDLARLSASFRQYDWLRTKDRVTAAFTWTWSAWSRQKMELASAYTTNWYWQNQQLLLEDWERNGLENICRLVSIENIKPLFVKHEPEGDGSRLVVAIRAKVVDYVVVRGTEQVVQGDKKVGDLTTVWTFLWEGGEWKLNLIEQGSHEWDYLIKPNEVPKAVPAPSVAR